MNEPRSMVSLLLSGGGVVVSPGGGSGGLVVGCAEHTPGHREFHPAWYTPSSFTGGRHAVQCPSSPGGGGALATREWLGGGTVSLSPCLSPAQ